MLNFLTAGISCFCFSVFEAFSRYGLESRIAEIARHCEPLGKPVFMEKQFSL